MLSRRNQRRYLRRKLPRGLSQVVSCASSFGMSRNVSSPLSDIPNNGGLGGKTSRNRHPESTLVFAIFGPKCQGALQEYMMLVNPLAPEKHSICGCSIGVYQLKYLFLLLQLKSLQSLELSQILKGDFCNDHNQHNFLKFDSCTKCLILH